MKLLACFMASYLAFCLAKSDASPVTDAHEFDTKTGIGNECTDVHSCLEVHTVYKGLFMTPIEMFLQQFLYNLDRDIILSHEGVKGFENIVGSKGDGDSCCITEIETYHPDVLQNVFKKKKKLVQLKQIKKFQYISQGKCVGKGKCDGVCVLEYTTRSVLVESTDSHGYQFDQVLVPTYCSCKKN